MATTMLIEWTDEFSVDVPSIDAQHKKLVDLINDLNAAMENGETDAVLGRIFADLLAYTERHFAYEEQLFEKTGFAASDAHCREHEALRDKVTDLQGRLQRGEFMLGVEVMSFLRDWLTQHIMVSDKAYTRHFIANGVR